MKECLVHLITHGCVLSSREMVTVDVFAPECLSVGRVIDFL